jgi:hypothetical protein
MFPLLLLVLAGAVHTTPAFASAPPLKVYLTRCDDGTPMPGAKIEAILQRGGTQVGKVTQVTNNAGLATFSFNLAQCCDELLLTVTPSGGGDPYSELFRYNCGGCGDFDEEDWFPSSHGRPCEAESCCPIRWGQDPSFWNVRYFVP